MRLFQLRWLTFKDYELTPNACEYVAADSLRLLHYWLQVERGIARITRAIFEAPLVVPLTAQCVNQRGRWLNWYPPDQGIKLMVTTSYGLDRGRRKITDGLWVNTWGHDYDDLLCSWTGPVYHGKNWKNIGA